MPSLPRIVEASKGARLDKIEQGYESMDAFSVSLEHLTEAVHALDFDPGNSAPSAPSAGGTLCSSWCLLLTSGRSFAAEEDEEYFDGEEEEEVEENVAPERTVMGKGLSPPPQEPPAPRGSSGGLGSPSSPHPLPRQLPCSHSNVGKAPGHGMSGDAFGMGGTQGRARQRGEPALLQHRTLFYTGANRTIPHVL